MSATDSTDAWPPDSDESFRSSRRASPPAHNDLDVSLMDADPQLHALMSEEVSRQRQTLEMIASENFAPVSVLQAQGSILTNKYSEGYPGRRYYGGCAHIDEIERLAIVRARKLFSADHANVQPHSGAQANAAAFGALMKPGDTVMGLALSHGGHLSHGTTMNASGTFYKAVRYHLDADTGLVNLETVASLARQHRPRVIVAGWTAYPRMVDWAGFRHIADEVGAFLVADMAHLAGLIAAGVYPSPVPYADVVTSTTHKTLGGARGGLVLCRGSLADRIDAAVFPGPQGGALNQSIAAKAATFHLAGRPGFVERQRRTLQGAKIIAERLCQPDIRSSGIQVVTGGTDCHLVLLDLSEAIEQGRFTDGADAERHLESIGVTVNRNTVPNETRTSRRPSGLRLATSALATRGFDGSVFAEVAEILADALTRAATAPSLSRRVSALANQYPLYATTSLP